MQAMADTRGMDRAEWLKLRRGGIGGSDAAAIVGMSPYRSAYAVWADKLGYLPEREDNEAMRQGRDFEDYVARRFSERTGKRVQRVNRMLRHPEYEWMIGNIDRRVLGERAGLECKTSKDLHLRRYKNGEYPDEYYAQCQHYMAVTGYPMWHLAVLVYGTDLLTYEIPRDEEDIRALIDAERAFWEGHVLTGIQPATDGSQATTDALRAVYPRAEQSEPIPCPNEGPLARYLELHAQIKVLEAEKDAMANAIKAMLGTHEGMASPNYLATWKNSARSHLDESALREDYPELDLNAYRVKKQSRTFTIRAMKEDT